jgi:hypothetical protein
VIEVTVGNEDLFQEGDIELLAQLVEHAVMVAGVDEGAALVQDVNIAAHAGFFHPPDTFKPWVVFSQMDHCSSDTFLSHAKMHRRKDNMGNRRPRLLST